MADQNLEDIGLIFVSADGINLFAPWRLAAYPREGSLTYEQMTDLAARFSFDPAEVIFPRLGGRL